MEYFKIIFITSLIFICVLNEATSEEDVLVNQDESNKELDVNVTKVELKENKNEQTRTLGIFGSPNILSGLFGANSDNNNEENYNQKTPSEGAVIANEDNSSDNLDVKLTKVELKEKNEEKSNSIGLFNFPNMLGRLFGSRNEGNNDEDNQQLEENQNLLSGVENNTSTTTTDNNNDNDDLSEDENTSTTELPSALD